MQASADFERAYREVRQAVALFEFDEWELVRVDGSERRDFLQRVLSADVSSLQPGQGAPSALLTPKGRVVSAMDVLAGEQSIDLLVDTTSGAALCQQLERYSVIDDVSISVVEDTGVLALYGPELASIEGLTPLPGPYEHRRIPIEPSVSLVGDDRLATLGCLIIGPREALRRLRGGLDIDLFCKASESVYEACRIEAGVPRFGAELGEASFVLEAGQLGRVSLNKGCYIGQEPVCRVQSRGRVQRMLVGLRSQRHTGLQRGQRLRTESRSHAGVLTSTAHSPGLGTMVALGYLHRSCAEPGTVVEVDGCGKGVVTRLPMLDGLVAPLTCARFKA